MNQATVRPLIAADILKLRRHRGTMTTAALLSVGMAIVYFAFIEARHHGNLAGPQVLSDGATMTGTYFGAFAAILIGAEAGTTDLASGVFRDLVATGRSRTTLFLVRIPAAVTIAVTLTLSGYAVAVAAAYAGHGSAQAPTAGLALVAELEATGELATYHLLPATRADLLRRLGRHTEAAVAYRTALALDPPAPEASYLRRRLAEVDGWTTEAGGVRHRPPFERGIDGGLRPSRAPGRPAP